MKILISKLLPIIDVLLFPLVYPCAWLLKNIRYAGVHNLPRCRKALLRVGVFPVRNHYYEPQFDHRGKQQPFSQNRSLPAIDWNINEQLKLLETFSYAQELENIQNVKPENLDFYFNNGAFESGDAEYWYQLIRSIKPKRIFEIGSGKSTLMTLKAVSKNQQEDPDYRCKLVCIEPYEMPWLEDTGVLVVRKKVEDIELTFFSELEENDILFIDSSHIIRPHGDVLFEFLELLPNLNRGVIVHIHDIFSPKNYPKEWLEIKVRFWNEQYLLEAFLSHNSAWKIIGSLNYLHHQHFEELKTIAPYLTSDREPGSFYIQKVI